MQRRRFLVGGTVGCLASISGCTAVDLPQIAPKADRHPFADETLSVRIDNEGSTTHDVEENTREVLDFWRTESSQYVDFEIDFEIVGERPDIIMAYVDTPEGCSAVENYSSSSVLGCAPRIKAGNRVSRPVTAYVVAANRPIGSIRTTAKHEIGHILGLGHDDEPREIMSNRPEDRIPRYEIRIDIWETALTGHEEAIAGSQQLNEAINGWNAEEYEAAEAAFSEATTRFVDAQEAFAAAEDRTADLESEPPLETVDYQRLETVFDHLLSRMDAASDAAGTMIDASTAAGSGDDSSARRLSAEANGRLAEYNELGPLEIRTVAVALGLVRGFDREPSAVAVEEPEI